MANSLLALAILVGIVTLGSWLESKGHLENAIVLVGLAVFILGVIGLFIEAPALGVGLVVGGLVVWVVMKE